MIRYPAFHLVLSWERDVIRLVSSFICLAWRCKHQYGEVSVLRKTFSYLLTFKHIYIQIKQIDMLKDRQMLKHFSELGD